MQTYLGRPWRDHAHVAFIDTEMTGVVRAEGWHNWNRPEREQTVRYLEAGSRGAGPAMARRVTWAKALTGSDASAMTPRAVLAGTDGWDPGRLPAFPAAVRATGDPLPAPPGSSSGPGAPFAPSESRQ